MSESTEQQCLFRWAAFQRSKYPELELLYHIPNEGKRTRSTGARLKAEGLKPGVPDVCLPVPRGQYIGLYIEMKYGNNKPTKDQRRWLAALAAQGHYTAVCYDWEAASKLILAYLKNNI